MSIARMSLAAWFAILFVPGFLLGLSCPQHDLRYPQRDPGRKTICYSVDELKDEVGARVDCMFGIVDGAHQYDNDQVAYVACKIEIIDYIEKQRDRYISTFYNSEVGDFEGFSIRKAMPEMLERVQHCILTEGDNFINLKKYISRSCKDECYRKIERMVRDEVSKYSVDYPRSFTNISGKNLRRTIENMFGEDGPSAPTLEGPEGLFSTRPPAYNPDSYPSAPTYSKTPAQRSWFGIFWGWFR